MKTQENLTVTNLKSLCIHKKYNKNQQLLIINIKTELLKDVFRCYLKKQKSFYIKLVYPTIIGKWLQSQMYILKIRILPNFCLVSTFTKRIEAANQIYIIFAPLDVFAIIQIRIPIEQSQVQKVSNVNFSATEEVINIGSCVYLRKK